MVSGVDNNVVFPLVIKTSSRMDKEDIETTIDDILRDRDLSPKYVDKIKEHHTK